MTRSELNILVRVNSRAALAQLKALGYEVNAVGDRSNLAGSKTSRFIESIRPTLLQNFGNRLQWAGRQLEYNFTLPIAAAGIAATKFEMDNEKAMAGVVKVYGDGSKKFNKLTREEIPALGKAFEVLSNEFAVNRAQVIGVAADWAQAGATGIALAKSVKLTLETMILGEMDAASATQALIAIQAQYGQSTGQLANTIDVLNQVENQTGITMEGLVQGFARAAGVARSAGVDVRHLAAFLAALTPAAGSASQAGNALKTIFSRILAPTQASADLMKMMHIEVASLAWQTANGTQKLEIMAKSFDHLSNSQKALVSATVASRYQINKFDVLMRDIINTNGYYQKSLNSTADATANYRQRVYELNTVLNSNPQRLKQVWVILQNALADIIQPLLPAIISLATSISKLFLAFENLSPSVQKLIGLTLLLVALVGPIERYVGSFITLFTAIPRLFAIFSGVIIAVTGDMIAFLSVPFGAFTAGLGGIFGIVLGAGKGIIGVLGRMSLGFLRLIPSITLIGPVLGGFLAFWRGTLATATGLIAAFVTKMRIFPLMVELGFTSFRQVARFYVVAVIELFSGLWSAIAGGLVAFFPRIIALFSGGFTALIGRIAAAAAGIGEALLAVLTGPWGIAIAVITALVLMFHKQIVQVWDNIVQAFQNNAGGIMDAFKPIADFFGNLVSGIVHLFYRLPVGIQNAMLAVIKVIETAALKIYELFQYLNPFAHHSPSLVENTQKGMKVVGQHHKKANESASNLYKSTGSDIASFNRQTNYATTGAGSQYSSNRQAIKKVDPAALASFDRLIKDLNVLNALESKQKAAIDALQPSVDKWAISLDKANAKLGVQQDKLNILTAKQTRLQAIYDNATSKIQQYSQAPIKGMQRFSDELFRNQMRQNKLQLAMDKWSDTHGSLDDMQNKLQGVNGALEVARGTMLRLQAGGAGSEITSVYANQVNQLEKQQGRLSNNLQNSPIAAMTAQLDKLQNKADELNLEQSLKFDPLTRKVDQLANGMKELPFDEIIRKIKQQKAAQDAVQPSLDRINKKVKEQTHIVTHLTNVRDRIQKSYDIENAKLQLLQDRYNKTSDSINAVTDALTRLDKKQKSTASSKKAAAGAGLSPTQQQFLQGAKGNFPDVGGNAKIGREGGFGSQADMIDKWTQNEAKKIGQTFGSFDLLGPIKDKVNQAKAWFSKNIAPVFAPLGHALGNLGHDLSHSFDGVDMATPLHKVFDPIGHAIMAVVRVVQSIWRLVGPDIQLILRDIVNGFKELWKNIAPQVAAFGQLIQPIGHLIANLWTIAKPILAVLAVTLLELAKIILSVIGHTLPIVFHTMAAVISGSLQVIRGALQFIIGFINTVIDIVKFMQDILTLHWGKAWAQLKQIITQDLGGMAKGIWNIIDGMWRAITGLFAGALNLIYGLVSGFVHGVWGFFKWLYKEVVVKVVENFIKGIVKKFHELVGFGKWIWQHILKPIVDYFKSVWKDHIQPNLKIAVKGIEDFWKGLKWIARWIWDHILKPIGDYFKSIWTDHIKPNLQTVVQSVKDMWGKLSDLGHWIWDHVLSPVVGFFKSAWKHIKDGIGSLRDHIRIIFYDVGTLIMKGINLGISGVDKLIGGLNWIGQHIPGLKFTIPTIAKLEIPPAPAHASGARMSEVGAGFRTAGARAIVGEGNRNHPEYVIPTDPRYRSNANHLLSNLVGDMHRRGTLHGGIAALAGVPGYFGGGVLHGIGGLAGKAWDGALGVGRFIRREAVTAAFAPFLKAADFFINKMPNGLHERDWINNEKNSFYNWAKGTAGDMAEKARNPNYIPPSIHGANASTGLVWSTLRTLGMSPRVTAGIMGNLESESGFNPYIIQGGGTSRDPRAAGSGGYGLAQWTPGSKLIPYLHGAMPTLQNELGAIVAQLKGQGPSPETYAYSVTKAANTAYEAGRQFGLHYERYKLPEQPIRAQQAQMFYNMYHGSMGGANVHGPGKKGQQTAHRNQLAMGGLIPSLAEGAIIRRRAGGVIVRVAEGANDEIVAPITRKPHGGDGSTVNIYGDLSFPNITSGDDADTFITNLRTLAGSG